MEIYVVFIALSAECRMDSMQGYTGLCPVTHVLLCCAIVVCLFVRYHTATLIFM